MADESSQPSNKHIQNGGAVCYYISMVMMNQPTHTMEAKKSTMHKNGLPGMVLPSKFNRRLAKGSD